MKINDIFMGLLVAFATGGFTYLMLDAASMPDVWVSYSTGECVQVLNYADGDNYSCENMPSKYNHVWVK